VLGELAHDSEADPVRGWRGELAADLFQLLREHGLIRSDLDLATQMYVVGAVQTGFYLHRPDLGSPDATAAALGHTIRATVQPPGTPDPDALAAVAPAVLERYQRFRATLAAAITAQPPQKGLA
jgi:hypothetical protein